MFIYWIKRCMNKKTDGDYYLAINENASNESPKRKGKVQFLAYLCLLINSTSNLFQSKKFYGRLSFN